eukprot:scaffold982_cov139-Cylindrotheca_fusiformis.AAC.19
MREGKRAECLVPRNHTNATQAVRPDGRVKVIANAVRLQDDCVRGRKASTFRDSLFPNAQFFGKSPWTTTSPSDLLLKELKGSLKTYSVEIQSLCRVREESFEIDHCWID